MDICDQASLVVTRCLDRAGFSDLDLLGPAPPPPPPPAPAGDSSQFDQTGLREILSARDTWGELYLNLFWKIIANKNVQKEYHHLWILIGSSLSICLYSLQIANNENLASVFALAGGSQHMTSPLFGANILNNQDYPSCLQIIQNGLFARELREITHF